MGGIKDLNGKVVVITGAGSGIGRAAALAFAREGARVVVTDVNEASAQETSELIFAAGGRATSCQLDVANEAAMNAFAEQTIAEQGGVDVLFNNAGIGGGGPTFEMTPDEARTLFEINWWGVANGVRAFVDHMKERGSGHIVSTSSAAGITPWPSLAYYTATKHAVLAFSSALRSELGHHNIGVSAICPGIINTEITKGGFVHDTETLSRKDAIRLYERWGHSPELVARATVKAVRKNKAIVPVGVEAWLLWYLYRLSPPLFELLFQRQLAASLK